MWFPRADTKLTTAARRAEEEAMEEASQGQIRTAQRRGREDLDRSGHQTWLEDQHEHHAMGLHGPRADSPEAASNASAAACTHRPRRRAQGVRRCRREHQKVAIPSARARLAQMRMAMVRASPHTPPAFTSNRWTEAGRRRSRPTGHRSPDQPKLLRRAGAN